MKMNEVKRFCVICPKQVDVPYINVYGFADSKSGFRFEIVAEFDDKCEAVKKAEENISNGKYAIVHDYEKHIDYYYRNHWEEIHEVKNDE